MGMSVVVGHWAKGDERGEGAGDVVWPSVIW